jgi:hypothetical protein
MAVGVVCIWELTRLSILSQLLPLAAFILLTADHDLSILSQLLRGLLAALPSPAFRLRVFFHPGALSILSQLLPVLSSSVRFPANTPFNSFSVATRRGA